MKDSHCMREDTGCDGPEDCACGCTDCSLSTILSGDQLEPVEEDDAEFLHRG